MKFPIMFGTCLILIPLCLIKDISKMRVTSLFSIIGLIYAILVIIIETPYYYENFLKNHSPSDVNWYDFSTGFDKHLNFFKGTATVFFAYTCHVGAFPVYKTLRNNIKRRINKVFQRSILLDFVIYILVGICGFLTQPIDTPGLIINRKKILTNDIFMVIARLIMAINLILSTPANYNAFRLSILGLFWETNEVPDKL
jgi:amino acid permease